MLKVLLISLSVILTAGLNAPGPLEEGKATRDDNMLLGNPSNAIQAPGSPNNYLVEKDQYVLSYNNSKGIPNWVSWHLSAAWKGSAKRSAGFKEDRTLPDQFFHVTSSAYTNSGFDRGHMCPSDDRDASPSDNAATFLMCNIIPQAPKNNQQVWKDLEEYCRDQAEQGKEMYIISGSYGKGGAGKNGPRTTIAKGKVVVPARIWKVILILPNGKDDLHRIGPQTPVIAVDIPNNQVSGSKKWTEFKTSINAIEDSTGFDLFSNLSDSIQYHLER